MDEWLCPNSAAARLLVPFLIFGPHAWTRLFVIQGPGGHSLVFYVYVINMLFWFPAIAIFFSADVRHYIEPLELVSVAMLLACRCLVGRCRLIVSKPVLKAPMVSALDTII